MKKILCPLKNANLKAGILLIIHDLSKEVTYQQFDQSVDFTNEYLKNVGIKARDRVAVLGTNCLEYLILLWALWRKKAIACLLSPRLPPKILLHQFKKMNCQAIWLSSQFDNLPIFNSLKKFSLKEIKLSKEKYKGLPKAFVNDKQESTILLTSGSAGEPKAVVLTLGNHVYNALGSNENIPVQPRDRWLLSLPLYHVSGLGILFRVILGKGALVLPPEKMDLINTIKKCSVTHISLVPAQLFRLLQDRGHIKTLKKLKVILLGGSPIPPLILKRAKECRLPVFTTYGLTEMASQVATSPQPIFALPASFSSKKKILKYREVKITQDQEILVRGRTLFKGYLKAKKVILPLNKQGWFQTGDLGSFDKGGFLTVIGRKDDMFISGGENIYPEEIEREILKIQNIEEVLVGPLADQEFGFRPIAFIKFKAKKKISPKIIIRALKQSLPRFKIPDQFYPWPLTADLKLPLGKTQRFYFFQFIKQRNRGLKF